MTDLVEVDPGPDGRDGAPVALETRFEEYRRELTGYAYRLLGSGFEAEDAVQETLLRAWRNADRFEGRSSLRTWLYRIATNVCLDMLKSRERRARPMSVAPARTGDTFGDPLSEMVWLQPFPDDRVLPAEGDPAETAVLRESVQLAFLAMLQLLPPRQRAVLVLREVLQWSAAEVAELLNTTVASVNSALQRSRATIAQAQPAAGSVATTDDRTMVDGEQRLLLDRYVDVFERYDMPGLVALLHEDATMSMPPYDLWVHGPEQIAAWMSGPGAGCAGSRVVPARAANGCPAFAQYRPDPDGGHRAFSLHVIETTDGRVSGINAFLAVDVLFPLFGLPDRLDPPDPSRDRADLPA